MHRIAYGGIAATLLLAVGACGGEPPLPTPRPLVISTGARLRPTPVEMQEIESWVLPQLDSIALDPGFLVEVVPVEEPTYPWHKVEVVGTDTVRIEMDENARNASPAFEIYAHLHLMRAQGRLDRWFPEAEPLAGYEQERAFVERTAEAWLYGRSIFDTRPYHPLEELVYARDAGLLDELLLMARADEFPDERSAWLAREPDGEEEFRSWYRTTFGTEFGSGGRQGSD